MATAVVKDTIYVCGGYNGSDSLLSVEAYRPDWRCWINRPSLSIERCAAAAAVLDDNIFGNSLTILKLNNSIFSNGWTQFCCHL